jgi:hypothetical protein
MSVDQEFRPANQQKKNMTAKLIVETTARYRLKFINCKFDANFGAQKCSTAVYILLFEF